MMKEGYTYNDVLLVPKRSNITSRKNVCMTTKLTQNIKINNPIVSSNMDTVTEAEMAIEMARNGGIGILHRFLSIEDQCNMVKQVKRAESYIIKDPYTMTPEKTIEELEQFMLEKGVGGILVVSEYNKLLGIVTSRDTVFEKDKNKPISDIMITRDALIVAEDSISKEEAEDIIATKRVKKLPLVDNYDDFRLMGLITAKDIINRNSRPHASLDKNGQLLVGAAIGVKQEDMERAIKLVEAGADVLVIDIAHGHSDLAIDMVKQVKEMMPEIDIIAGNVCTAEGTKDLILAGADCVKVGVGGGSICSTRIVTGCGVPQLTAVMDCVAVGNRYNIPIMADGGIKKSGDITKALAAGASTIMAGSLLAGCDESPGKTLHKDGRKVKIVRGMAGYGANISRQKKIYGKDDVFDMVPEGVEAVVPYKGAVKDVIRQLVGGLSSGMSYCGAHTIPELYINAEFMKITGSGIVESNIHDVHKI